MAKIVKIAFACVILFAGCGGPATTAPQLLQPLPKDSAKRLVLEAQSHVGEPYRYGGAASNGWDCSGFVRIMFRHALGVELPRTAREMFHLAQPIPAPKRRVGDLIFFTIESTKPSHVGIMLSELQFIHVTISDGVIVSSLDDPYYRRYFVGIRRLNSSALAIARKS